MTAWLIVAASFFSEGATEAHRLEKLRPQFSPPPGESVSIKLKHNRQHYRSANPDRMIGYIEVTPPKGYCLTINRGSFNEDAYVCKKQSVSFRLSDATREGFLFWHVYVGEDMTPTTLKWQSPYRIAYVKPIGQPAETPPEYRFLSDCVANINSRGERNIQLKLLDGPTWFIRFPAKDKLLPQPPEKANLTVITDGQSNQLTKEDEVDPVNPEDVPQSSDNGPAKKISVTDKIVDFSGDRKLWHIPLRDGYEMSSENFLPKGDVPPGMKGVCRYRFTGSKLDLDVGRIECKDADVYQFMYAPLTCMKELGGPRH